MGERGLGIRSGVLKQAWEQTDFPVVCENCLGDNPYIRMVLYFSNNRLKHQIIKNAELNILLK
mgnify:CR=1 FL=1